MVLIKSNAFTNTSRSLALRTLTGASLYMTYYIYISQILTNIKNVSYFAKLHYNRFRAKLDWIFNYLIKNMATLTLPIKPLAGSNVIISTVIYYLSNHKFNAKRYYLLIDDVLRNYLIVMLVYII